VKRRQPLQRKTPMPRPSKSLARGPVKPRRPQVSAEERRARQLVRARSGGICEGRCLNTPASDWHHRMPRSVGGPWDAANGMHLCRDCHSWVTDHPVDGGDLGWHLWSTNDPLEVPALRRGEWVLLDSDGGYEPVNPELLGGVA
jgi:5-methylcytosine-specific restriction endonuclease McrA